MAAIFRGLALFPLADRARWAWWSLVNVGMIYAALHSFPGKAGDEGFDLSNQYDAVLERVQREAAARLDVLARTDAAGRPEVDLTGSAWCAAARRVDHGVCRTPAGRSESAQSLVFHETGCRALCRRHGADDARPVGPDAVGIRRRATRWRRPGGSSCGDRLDPPAPAEAWRGLSGAGRVGRRRQHLCPLRPAAQRRAPLLLPRLRRRLRDHPGARPRPLLRAAYPRPGAARTTPRSQPNAATSPASSPRAPTARTN